MIKREKLINLRKSMGLTQNDIAKKAGIKRSRYASYETGYRSPNFNVVVKLKKILKTDDDSVFL